MNKLVKLKNLDFENLIVVGDLVGGNMVIVMMILIKEWKGFLIFK